MYLAFEKEIRIFDAVKVDATAEYSRRHSHWLVHAYYASRWKCEINSIDESSDPYLPSPPGFLTNSKACRGLPPRCCTAVRDRNPVATLAQTRLLAPRMDPFLNQKGSLVSLEVGYVEHGS